MEELKPCPFCGGKVVATQSKKPIKFLDPAVWHFINCEARCIQKSMIAPPCSTDVVASWNTRPIEEALRAELVRKDAEIKTLDELVKAYQQSRGVFMGIIKGFARAIDDAGLGQHGLEEILLITNDYNDKIESAITRLMQLREGGTA